MEKLLLLHKKSSDGHSDAALQKIAAQQEEFFARVTSAFPSGDMDGHCNYHKEVIEQMKTKKEFWTKLRYEIYRWGVIGVLIFFISQLAHAVGMDFGKFIDKFGGLFK